MAILRIKPSMIEPLPGDKIPEIVEAREGKGTLHDRLKNVDANTIRGYVPVNKNGDEVDGTLVLNGGAIVPEGAELIINGGFGFEGPISRVSATETTGTYGVSAVVASVSDAVLDTSNDEIVVDFQPTITGNFLIYVYFRVATTTTGLSLYVTYEDGGGLKHQTVIDQEYYDIGSYSLPPIFINSTAITPITISARAQIPDHIYISASIIGL